MTLHKGNTTRLFVRGWRDYYWYLLPTVQIGCSSKDRDALTHFHVESENQSYDGSKLEINFAWFNWTLNFDFWWNITKTL